MERVFLRNGEKSRFEGGREGDRKKVRLVEMERFLVLEKRREGRERDLKNIAFSSSLLLVFEMGELRE